MPLVHLFPWRISMNELTEINRRKEHVKYMLLRFVNARGMVSHEFLLANFFFCVDYYCPNANVGDCELNDRLCDVASGFLTELVNEGAIKVHHIHEAFMTDDVNTKCYHLTLNGAWRTFCHIKKSPKHKLTKHCFASQFEACLDDIFFINSYNYKNLEDAYGPFMSFDDPANPSSQENIYADDYFL